MYSIAGWTIPLTTEEQIEEKILRFQLNRNQSHTEYSHLIPFYFLSFYFLFSHFEFQSMLRGQMNHKNGLCENS